MSLFSLHGKVAVITGSSKGSAAPCRTHGRAGRKVVISSRKADACAEVAAAINARFGDGAAISLPANISSSRAAGIGRWCQRPLRENRHPGMQCSEQSVLRADGWHRGRAVPQNPRQQHHFQSLADRHGGTADGRAQGRRRHHRVVNWRSARSPVIGAYNVSKAADFQLARNYAVGLGHHNVRVNCIAPGLIKTDFARALWEDAELLKRRTATTPLRRIGEPDEIAGTAVYPRLAAGSFVTGQAIVVDGGVTIGS